MCGKHVASKLRLHLPQTVLQLSRGSLLDALTLPFSFLHSLSFVFSRQSEVLMRELFNIFLC